MVLKKIKKIVANHFGIDVSELNAKTNLKDEGDSLDILEIMLGIENEFEITLDDSELEGLETLGELAEYIESILR